ncbi:MAG: chromosome segregation protein SMC [Nanoarchaeota archaeon]
MKYGSEAGMTFTKINKIEMKGFKSFANKTEILFGDQFNCVLGPNGSGKSNILDALCFVLGKSSAKGLRAEKSANLIYNGGKLKNPAKEGMVAVYFDNSKKVFPEPTQEVKLARIIKATGQSVYKINEKTRTRQQILDLLSMVRINPDGHNIILQGDIIHLIEMNPNERRQIVEEIAGISIYEDKKEKALKELQRVEEKMNEAEIILTERKVYLSELKKERDQALKFKELDDKIKRNKATLLHNNKEKKKDEIKKRDKESSDHQDKIKKIDEEVIKLKKEIDENKQKIEKINAEVERKGEKEQVALHKEVETLKVEVALAQARIDTLKTERAKIDERIAEMTRSSAELDAKIKKKQADADDAKKRMKLREETVSQLDKKIGEFRKKNQLSDASDIDKKIEDIDKEADKLQEEIVKIRESQQNLLREKDRLEMSIQSIDTRIDKVLSVEKENRQAIVDLKRKKEEFKKATLELSKKLTESSSLAVQLENARKTILSKKEEYGRLRTRHSAISENVSGGVAIQKILELKKKEKGIHGTVSDLGVVQSKYALALEVAAGPRIKSIVVDNDVTAAKCISYLKQNRLGVATFLPLNKLSTVSLQGVPPKAPGVHDFAVNLVTYKPMYKKVFEYVFSNTLVVDDVETARRFGIGKARMSTLEGDLMEKSGAMQGGFRKKESMGLGFQEKELSDGMESLEKEIADFEAVISRLEFKRKDCEDAIERLREFKAKEEAEILSIEKTLHLESGDLDVSRTEKGKLSAEIKDIEKKIDGIVMEVSQKNKKLANLKIEKQELRDKMTQMRSPRLLAELNTFEEKRKEVLQEISDIRGDAKNAESEISNVLNPEKESIAKIIKQHEKEKTTFDKEKGDLEKQIGTKKKGLSEKEEAEKKFYAQFKELFQKRTTIANQNAKLEEKSSQKERDRREIEVRFNSFSLELARLKAELAGIEEEAKQYAGVPIFEGKDHDQIMKEIGQFERMATDIGAVNMKALEIYEKIEAEYRNLQEKRTSLVKEREDVLVMINEIDSKKRELFMKTFDVLTKNFKTIFTSLSTKGDAYLELENENDPFAGGLEIKVRLIGKKFLDIRSLSGGEKTLTALAFLFAIQEHEPASFYVLDEVDAALDKRNSEMLADLVKDYSMKAQYIIISHNDQIISTADTLYGISMTEHGISKITSLKI